MGIWNFRFVGKGKDITMLMYLYYLQRSMMLIRQDSKEWPTLSLESRDYWYKSSKMWVLKPLPGSFFTSYNSCAMPVHVGTEITSYQDAGEWTSTKLARTVVSCKGPWCCKQLVLLVLQHKWVHCNLIWDLKSFLSDTAHDCHVLCWQAAECLSMTMVLLCRKKCPTLPTLAWSLLLWDRCAGRLGEQ